MPDFCDLVRILRSHFFAKDRDVVLQTDRVFSGCGWVPTAGIIIWSGAIVNIPTCWQLCDGTNGTIDLRDRFVVGAGNSYAVGDTGGANTVDISHTHADGTYAAANDTHSHAENMTTGNDTHNHAVGTLATSQPTVTDTVEDGGLGIAAEDHLHTVTGTTANDTHSHGVTGNSANDTHNHDVTGNSAAAGSATQENRPLYYALAYIQQMN